MLLTLTDAQKKSLEAFLKNCPDAEALNDKEYVLDLFDIETPISLDLLFTDKGIFVDGAATLVFNDEMDGWCIADRIESEKTVIDALIEAGAIVA